MMENSFQKYDTLAKELKKAIIDAKPRLSDTDKAEIGNELKKASKIALRILDSVKTFNLQTNSILIKLSILENSDKLYL